MRGQQHSEYNLYMISQFDVASILSAIMERAPAGFGVGLHIRYQAPMYLFQTYPPAWLEEYSRDGLLMHDPIVVWAMAERGLIRWEVLSERDPAGVVARARKHGMRHGFAISLERGGSQSVGGFSRADRPFSSEEMEALHGLVARLHMATASDSPETQEVLRSLSVAFTQPGTSDSPGPGPDPH